MDAIVVGIVAIAGYRIGIEVERWASKSGANERAAYEAGYEDGYTLGRFEGSNYAREETLRECQESVKRSLGI
jgi:hypothetical protein